MVARKAAPAVNDQRMPQLVNTRKAAEILCHSATTLKRWRYQGVGPGWVRLHGRVCYEVSVLLQYIQKHTETPSVEAARERIGLNAARR